jgi:hypothetical protein
MSRIDYALVQLIKASGNLTHMIDRFKAQTLGRTKAWGGSIWKERERERAINHLSLRLKSRKM